MRDVIHRFLPTSAALGCSLLAASPAWAAPAPQGLSDGAVEAEIDFARGLAREWTFVELAQGVLDRVDAAGVPASMEDRLALARCELFEIAAYRLPDPTEINALLDKGIDAYQAFLDNNKTSDLREEAERAIVNLSVVYGRSIDIALSEAAGEEAEALRDLKVEKLTAALQVCESLIAAGEAIPASERSADATNALFNDKLKKGQMYAEIGRTRDNDVFQEEALDTFDNLANESGPATELGLRATVAAGDVLRDMGELGDALDYYLGAAELVYPMDPELRTQYGLDEEPSNMLQLRFNFIGLAMKGIQPTARESGQLDLAIERGMFMYNLYRQQGFALTTDGQDAMLQLAETMLDAGGAVAGNAAEGAAKWYESMDAAKEEVRRSRDRETAVDFALELVNQIAKGAYQPSTKIQAGRLLDAINSRPDVEISPSALLESAKAKLRGEEYEAALDSYYEVLGRLDGVDPAVRIQLAAESHAGIGRALRELGRPLQAALAYREGIERYEDEDDDINARNAQGFVRSVRSWGQTDPELRNNESYKAMLTRAEELAIEHVESTDPVIVKLRQAKRAMSAGDYEDALRILAGIDDAKGSQVDVREILKVNSYYKMEDFAKAYMTAKKYLEYSRDPANALEESTARDERRDAQAQAMLRVAELDYRRARKAYRDWQKKAADGSATDADVAKYRVFYESIVDLLKDFPRNYPDQKSLPTARLLLVEAHGKLGQLDEAEAVVKDMVEAAPDEKRTSDAERSFYVSLKASRDGFENEDGEPTDYDQWLELTRRMAVAISGANERAAKPKFDELLAEVDLWSKIDEFENVQSSGERILTVHGGTEDAREKKLLNEFVTPKMGEALVSLNQREDAYALLAPLIIGEDAPLRTNSATRILARAMFGELSGQGLRVQVVPGITDLDKDEVDFVVGRLDTFASQAEGAGDPCAYFQAKFDAMYARHAASLKLDQYVGRAGKLMEQFLTVIMGGDRQFTRVDEACNGDSTTGRLRSTLGGDVLASHYRWLLGQVE